VFIARQLMRQLSPSLLWITLHDIDIAHSGAYSLYLDGIRRSDRLCAEIWKAIETDPEYKGTHDDVHPAGLWPRLGYLAGRQRLSAPPHRRCALADDVDDGARAWGAAERRRGSPSGLAGSGADAW
jgi:hypothetical protein